MSQALHWEPVGLAAGFWWLAKLTAARPVAVADRLVRVALESFVDRYPSLNC